jgi:hypothetical protein
MRVTGKETNVKIDIKAYARTFQFKHTKETEIEFGNIVAAGKTVEEAKAKFVANIEKAISNSGPMMVSIGHYVAIVWYDTRLASWGYQIIHTDGKPLTERMGHLSCGVSWSEQEGIERARVHLATLALAEDLTPEFLQVCLRFVKTDAGKKEVQEAYQRMVALQQARNLGLDEEQSLQYVWQHAKSIPIPA